MLVSQVFISGQILRTVETPYDAEALEAEETLRERLKKQHRLLIAAVMRGKIDHGQSPAPDPDTESPALVVTPLADLKSGQRADLLILLRGDRTFRPVTAAALRIGLDEGAEAPTPVHAGTTDGKGFHLAEVRLPDSDAPDLSLVVVAESDSGTARAVLPVIPRKTGAPRPSTFQERPGLIVSDIEPPRRGEAASLMILVRGDPSTRPVLGAALRFLVVNEDDDEQLELSTAETDRRGFHLAQVSIPGSVGDGSSLVIQATTEFGVAETIIPIV